MPPRTSWAARKAGFVLTVDHVETDWHQWVYLDGWQSRPTTVRRDWLGRQGASYIWLVLHCNNTDCPAQALVRIDDVERRVEAWLPVPRSAPPNPEEEG